MCHFLGAWHCSVHCVVRHTNGRHDGYGEEERFGEGPGVGPVGGRVEAVVLVVLDEELLEVSQIPQGL
jgi:hypothetical protein